MKFFILISALSLVSGQQWGTLVNQCVFNSGPLPITTQIAGCSIPPCTLYSGQSNDFDILFRAPHNLNSLSTRFAAFVGVFPVLFDLGPAGDTCSHLLSGTCPAGQGALLLHRLGLFISLSFQNIALPIEISIVDENNESVACFRVNVNIVGAQKLDTSKRSPA